MGEARDKWNQKPDDPASYADLLNRYNELQLRVTRFSSVEQQMINIRNRLDREITMHKRMHDSNKKALLEMSDEAFSHFIAESVVDIFEVEVGIAMVIHNGEEPAEVTGIEGARPAKESYPLIRSVLEPLCDPDTSGNILKISRGDFEKLEPHLPLDQAYGSLLSDHENRISLLVVGGILKSGVRTYEPLDRERDIIFSVFTQQVLAHVVNRKKNKTILNQVENLRKHEQLLASIVQT